MINYFLGIDGGGTKTSACLINEEGRIISEFQEEGLNFLGGHSGTAKTSLEKIISKAFEFIARDNLKAVSISTAGISHKHVQGLLSEVLNSYKITSQVFFSGDNKIALYSIFPSGYGTVLMSGTGSMCYSRTSYGEFRAGGYGYLLGDEGSGFDIGKQLLKKVCISFDSGKDSVLTEYVKNKLGIYSAQDIIQYVYKENFKTSISSLSPILDILVEQNDPDGNEILDSVSASLIDLVSCVFSRIRNVPDEIGVYGSVILKSRPVYDAVKQKLSFAFPDIRVMTPIYGSGYASALVALRECK